MFTTGQHSRHAAGLGQQLRGQLARGLPGQGSDLAGEMRLIVVAAGKGHVRPGCRGVRLSELESVVETQDASDRLRRETHRTAKLGHQAPATPTQGIGEPRNAKATLTTGERLPRKHEGLRQTLVGIEKSPGEKGVDKCEGLGAVHALVPMRDLGEPRTQLSPREAGPEELTALFEQSMQCW